ncbi:hypothetical protein CDV55_101572 [Aspergillus turcosus]|uniref:Ketoreductase domain-containing protein n=1 Tax=Aspergillus turcosus TaxID=1245748 RepID=A0A229WTL9_9EURO|nr:hypothetical protein CDV55_101572 [Aspergillus turcosus]RLL95902.1 hypothetical protein CFD26_101216 [Aspergillus turcosus]
MMELTNTQPNKSYCGVNLIDFENNPTPRAVALFQAVAGLMKDRVIKPVAPIQLFSFSKIEKAFRYMQQANTWITPEATYVLAGGLGGICREIGRWLAEKGAKHLVFLSRSAATGEANIAFIKNLRETVFWRSVGGKVFYQCVDVLRAMVLRDTLFDGMTVDHLRTTVGPKDLDFFVMLSSLAGVMGHRGQGNYGAGNIFSDLHALMAIAMEGTSAHPPQVMCGLPTNEYSESWYWIWRRRANC